MTRSHISQLHLTLVPGLALLVLISRLILLTRTRAARNATSLARSMIQTVNRLLTPESLLATRAGLTIGSA